MSLFAELKRRNVFRVGIAYGVATWVLIQIADILLDNFGAPAWVMKSLVVALVVGFFISLFFAWAFEMTPEGVKRESEVDRSQSMTQQTGQKLNLTIIGLLVLALGYFAWDKFSEQPQAVSLVESAVVEEIAIDKSIAVLPFVNMSADADNEYFSDGLSEELLNLLAKVDGLKVAARTSSFQFKDSEADIAEIGAQLNVATVLEGSVRKSGNQARITAQLIKVDDGFHMWSETYDRDLDNIFVVQDEIAKAIVDALKLPLLGHDAQPLTSTTSTENFAAYDLYLLGRHHTREYSEEGFKRAIEYYLRALEVDPAFAAAYSGLADGYIYLANFGDLPQGEALQLAQDAAEKALAINPDSPEAHASMGLLRESLGQERAAEIHLQEALQINPNYVNALLWYRDILSNQFRNNEAMSMLDRASNIDPLSHNVRRARAEQLPSMGRFDEATGEIQGFIAANPDDAMPYEVWGSLFQTMGSPQNAIPMYRNAHRLRPGDIYMAWRNTQCGLQLDDENLVAYWLNEARNRGIDGQWTKRAETMLMYANGDYSGLLNQMDQFLETSPGHIYSQLNRGIALMYLGQTGAAQEALQLALSAGGYVPGQALKGNELIFAVQLANVLDQNGDTAQRDAFIAGVESLLVQLRRDEPPNGGLEFIGAGAASVKNDLPGVLRALEAAVEAGFRNHWELLRNPVFKRWQTHPDFIAFHQGMLEAAARMRAEYYANNPVEPIDSSAEGTN